MHHRVLIPEGRSEYEWLRLLDEKLEIGEQVLDAADAVTPSFGTVVGVVPTQDSAVAETFSTLRRLRGGIVPLLDGDDAGNAKIKTRCLCAKDTICGHETMFYAPLGALSAATGTAM